MRYIIHRSDELYHYGVKGMKWGSSAEQKNRIVEQLDLLELDYLDVVERD